MHLSFRHARARIYGALIFFIFGILPIFQIFKKLIKFLFAMVDCIYMKIVKNLYFLKLVFTGSDEPFTTFTCKVT